MSDRTPPARRTHAARPTLDGTELSAELAAALFGLGGALAVVGLFIPALRPASFAGGVATAVAALVVGLALHLTRRLAWSELALRWTVVVAASGLITAYNLATLAEPHRYSVFYFFLVLWIGLTQPRGTSLATTPLLTASYLAPLLVLDRSPGALLSTLFILPTIIAAGEVMAWFSAQRTLLRDQLAEVIGELEAVDAQRALFLDTASHELRSPLATTRASLSTLEEHHQQLAPEALGELVQVTQRQVDRMQRMIDDMLASSRIRSGALSCHPRPVHVGPELPELLNPRLTNAVEFDEIALDACRVVVDPDHLAQMLNNLLANAHRYGAEPIEVTATTREAGIELRVADHGPGIPDEHAASLFTQYDHTGETQGLGLGLHIVQQLVERNGGTVRHEPVDPHGACFVLTLPRADG